MKTALILHGMPSKEEYFDPNGSSPSNSHWLPWVQHQLLLNNILAQTPELPHPYQPVYEKWCEVFERFQIDEQTHLIGHSCGAGFLIRWLSEHDVRVGKLALVAPWLDPTHSILPDFFNFHLDSNLVNRTAGTMLYLSKDDDNDIQKSASVLKDQLQGLQIQEFPNRGHFTFADMKTDQFPELLNLFVDIAQHV